jgi:hypothetical protein
MTHAIEIAILFVAMLLAFLELVDSRGRSLAAWGVALIAILLLWGRL